MKVSVRGYKGRGAGSRFIKWFTFGEYSHVSLVFHHDDGHVEEIEALQGRGVISHAPSLIGEYIVRSVPISGAQASRAYLFARSLVGSRYDWTGIYGFLVRRKRHSSKKWFCSEAVAYVLYKAGYPVSRRQPFRETPSTIMESYRLL